MRLLLYALLLPIVDLSAHWNVPVQPLEQLANAQCSGSYSCQSVLLHISYL